MLAALARTVPTRGRYAGYHRHAPAAALSSRPVARAGPPAATAAPLVSRCLQRSAQRPAFALVRGWPPVRALTTGSGAAGEGDDGALEARPDPGPGSREKGALYSRGGVGHDGVWRWDGKQKLHRVCNGCWPRKAVGANYPDEDGHTRRLCADCSREIGAYAVRNPCRDCPEEGKTEAAYPDEDGNLRRLCAGCAKAAGSHAGFSVR